MDLEAKEAKAMGREGYLGWPGWPAPVVERQGDPSPLLPLPPWHRCPCEQRSRREMELALGGLGLVGGALD